MSCTGTGSDVRGDRLHVLQRLTTHTEDVLAVSLISGSQTGGAQTPGGP